MKRPDVPGNNWPFQFSSEAVHQSLSCVTLDTVHVSADV